MFLIKQFSLRIKYIGITVLAAICCPSLYGQQVEMSQFYSAPLQLNPALTGIAYGPRANINYRNQWSSLGDGFNGGYTTYMASYDMHINAIRSGIGVLFTGDQVMNNIYGSYSVSLTFAPQIKISKKMALKAGFAGTYIHRRLKWGELQFSDMIDPFTGFFSDINVPNPTGEPTPERLSTNRGDVGFGLVLFTQKLYFGAAVNNLVMNKENFTDGVPTRTPVRAALHFGGTFVVKKNVHYSSYISPNIMLVNQGRNFQANGGLLAGISMAYFGTQFRYAFNNPDAVIFVAGLKKGKFRLGYSYDYPVSKLINRTGGTHELTFTFNWAGDDNSLLNRTNRGIIECPEILNF